MLNEKTSVSGGSDESSNLGTGKCQSYNWNPNLEAKVEILGSYLYSGYTLKDDETSNHIYPVYPNDFRQYV